jgi:glutaredoxin
VKEFLSQRRVPFTVKLVDEDDEAYDELLKLGYRAVPVTVIDGQAIQGFDVSALTTALEGRAQST